jgi:lysophospholipase L1-like esterase
VVIWQGSRILIDFEGDSIALHFADAKGQNFFDARIDDGSTLVDVRENRGAVGNQFSNLGPGRHQLILFKRSEAAAGTARFTGIELADDSSAFTPDRPRYKLAMQFFGDSITAGACNEDGATDGWEDRSTHNNARSYGAFTAEAFSADYRNIAVSGMGIVTGWTSVKAKEIWDRVYPEANSPRADLTRWTPHVVFVNLGENDDSFTKAKEQPFPSDDYIAGYVALVQSIRNAYPQAQIVILRGGMFGGAQSERLREPWRSAVAKIESADSRVAHFVFQHWSNTHPRVADHRAMAEELIAWLSTQEWMQGYR